MRKNQILQSLHLDILYELGNTSRKYLMTEAAMRERLPKDIGAVCINIEELEELGGYGSFKKEHFTEAIEELTHTHSDPSTQRRLRLELVLWNLLTITHSSDNDKKYLAANAIINALFNMPEMSMDSRADQASWHSAFNSYEGAIDCINMFLSLHTGRPEEANQSISELITEVCNLYTAHVTTTATPNFSSHMIEASKEVQRRLSLLCPHDAVYEKLEFVEPVKRKDSLFRREGTPRQPKCIKTTMSP